ncbi:stearoyl-CoA desaturase 5-like isoform X2 [Centruroides sculpturatus]|uniref:stearoyl-CoA desaturase 5-like isoform X2 n=2 Tax=Centruroides sculpturatus TaxID=218467 RepID=UPI000C6D04CF|nr:stearoyl-CoA desaturase 5-like isoform X2 [Centruroides sculpturatus]
MESWSFFKVSLDWINKIRQRNTWAICRKRTFYGDRIMTAEMSANQVKIEPHKELVWKNVILLTFLHVASLYSLYLTLFRSQWKTIIFAVLYGMIAGLGITAGAHRLWCHRSYKATLPLRILLCIFNCMAVQTDIYDWCRDHRVHHKFSETDADPHNSNRGFFFSHIGWLFYKKHPDVLTKGKTVDLSDLLADPVVRFQRKFYIPLSIVFGFLISTFIPYRFWNEELITAFFVASIGRYTFLLHSTWAVNSLAHLYGYRPYDKKINARENWFVTLFALGEGFHNYHHTFPWDYSTSEFGKLFNFSTAFIDLMAWLGFAYNLKHASGNMIKNVKENRGKTREKEY